MSTAKRVLFSIELAIDSDSNGCIGGSIIHKTKLDWYPARIRPGTTGTEIEVVVTNANGDAGGEIIFRLPNTHRLSHLLKLQGSFLPSSSVYSPSVDPSGSPTICNVTAGLSTVAVNVGENGQQHQQQKLGTNNAGNPGGTVCVVAIRATVDIPLTSKSYIQSKGALAAVLQLQPWSVGYDSYQQQYDSSISTQKRLNDLYKSLRPPPLEDFYDNTRTHTTIGRLASLPIEHLRRILCYAGALSLRQLSACSHGTLTSCMGVYPGLKLNLFPHQASSLAWMEHVERKKYQFPLMWRRLGRRRVMVNEENDQQQWWLNIETGEVSPNPPPVEPAIRGGMLCDEPGLGKTITVAGLILRNINRVAKPPPPPPPPPPSQAELNFSFWCKEDRSKCLLSILRRIQKLDDAETFNCLMSNQALARWGMTMYEEIVGPPPWPDLVSISCSVSKGKYQTLAEFETETCKIFTNAISYHGGTRKGDDDVGGNTCCGSVVQDRHAAAYHYPGAVPHIARFAEEFLSHFNVEMSKLRTLLLYKKRNQTERQEVTKSSRPTIASAATLIIVPPPLMHHWQEQFESHIEDGFRGLMLFDYHQPKSQPLPSSNVLCKYDVVVTTYARLTNERTVTSDTKTFWDKCPLFGVYWQRLVMDEGHSLGGGGWTNYKDAALCLEAECRWIMTGTPSPAVFSLSNYLLFLRAKVGSTANCMSSICRSFRAGAPEGTERLRCILTDIMTSHTKEDVKIPPPVRTTQKLDMSLQESIAYDSIASYVRANILLTSILRGRTSAWQDSLLNSTNIKYALRALYNLRLACCGGGTMLPTLKRIHELETLDYLCYLHGAQEIDLARIAGFMRRVTSGELSSCQSCGGAFQILLITPCAHTVCTECVDQSCSSTCAVCHKKVDIDDFQRLQPGFEQRWKWNEPQKTQHLDGAATPLSFSGRTNNNNAGSEVSEVGLNNNQPNFYRVAGQEQIVTTTTSVDETSRLKIWEEELAREEAARELSMHSKASFVIQTVAKEINSVHNSDPNPGNRKRPFKALVFSQFRFCLNLVGDQLIKFLGGFPSSNWEKKGQTHVAEFWGQMKNVELKKFCCDPECKVLLLGKDGSHGLDLSFSTHLFLLEGVWNSSLESQIVSRAHRMGATGSVKVIQLIMKDTIEEQMQRLAERVQESSVLYDTVVDDSTSGGDSGSTTTPSIRRSSSFEKSDEKQKGKNTVLTSETESSSSTEGVKIQRIHYLLSNARPSRKCRSSNTNRSSSCLSANDKFQIASPSMEPQPTTINNMENHSVGSDTMEQLEASKSKKRVRRVAFSEEC
eukprot:87946_1